VAPSSRARREPVVVRPGGSRAAWIAAAAVGAILGIVGVLWNYQPAPAKPRPAPDRHAALVAEEAEQAWKKASAESREAESVYQALLKQYEQSLQDLARNRVPKEAVVRNLEKLRKQAQVVQRQQRTLDEMTRLRDEARQALRERP
jgi:hypothetical protein